MPGTNRHRMQSSGILTLCCSLLIGFQDAAASQQLLSIECPEILSQGALNKTYLLCRDAKTYSQATEDAKPTELRSRFSGHNHSMESGGGGGVSEAGTPGNEFGGNGSPERLR